MNLLHYKWTKGQSDFEIVSVEKINDVEHFEQMYKDAFDTSCATMEFGDELFAQCEHSTDECADFYFCIIDETQKDSILEKPLPTDDMDDLEIESNRALPEVLYGKNIIHLLINKSACFRFTADNQTYLHNAEQRAEAESEYEKMLTNLISLCANTTRGENMLVKNDGIISIKHLTEEERTAEKIVTLQKQLSQTDYKVVANQECIQAGADCLHEPKELHTERQALRNEINQLENTL